MSLPPGTVLGRYRILRRLGAGAMGEVYLAEDPQIERKLALKTVRILSRQNVDTEELEARLLREAKAAGRLVHSHVVTLFDAGEAEGLFYLAFEYVDGPDLSQRMKAPPPLTLGQILRIGREAAEGLEAAHRREIVHRDIKPSNLLLDSEDRIKISDFGIAKMVGQKTELTQTGSVIGSPHYLSPEQVRGEELDGRSDLFSLGVVLYELLTRRRPFEGDTITTLVYQILSRDPTPIGEVVPALPIQVQEIVDRLLEKDRADRFDSAEGLARALRSCEEKIPSEDLAAPPALSGEAEETRVLGEESTGAGDAKISTAPTVVQAPPGPKAPAPSTPPPPPPTEGSEPGPKEPPDAAPPPPPPAEPTTPPVRSPRSDAGGEKTRSRGRGWLVGLLLGLGLALALGAGFWWLSRSRGSPGPPEVNGEIPEQEVAFAETAGSGEEEITEDGSPPPENRAGEVGTYEAKPPKREGPTPGSGAPDEQSGATASPESGSESPEGPAAFRDGSASGDDVPSAGDAPRPVEAAEPPEETPSSIPKAEPDRPRELPKTREPEVERSVEEREPAGSPRPTAEPEPAERSVSEPSPRPEDLLDKIRSRVDRELTTGLGLVFDVDPEETFVLLRGRGDRRFLTLGQASEWSGGDDGRIYTLPGPGDYLLRFRDPASREKVFLIHARPGSGPTEISVNMNALSGERVDRGDLTRYRVGEGITLDVEPRRAARGAFVVVDGERRGGARQFSSRGSALRLSTGDHRVAVVAPGFRRVDFLVEVRPGHDEGFEEIEVEMEPER